MVVVPETVPTGSGLTTTVASPPNPEARVQPFPASSIMLINEYVVVDAGEIAIVWPELMSLRLKVVDPSIYCTSYGGVPTVKLKVMLSPFPAQMAAGPAIFP